MNKYDGLVGLVGITFGLVGVGYAWGTHSKMAKISEKLDCAIDDLANKTPVDIPDELIERAVEKAVALEVKQAVSKATDVAVAAVKRDIHKQIVDAVESEYSSIKDAVLEELVTEAAKIDVKRVRADVEKVAREIALSKFDDNLDDILNKHNSELENVTKIYKAIADAVAPNKSNDNEMVLRIAR
jgi:hydroxypyruvate isomerase